MPIKNDIKKEIEKSGLSSRFQELFSIHILLTNCLYSDGHILTGIPDKISLTDLGQKRLDELRSGYDQSDEQVIKMALLFNLYHESLYIDLDQTDLSGIINIISDNIKNRKILLIWKHGLTLYNKYFDEFKEQSETLDFNESKRLLKDTPQGVFQINELLVGPYGILKSQEDRFIKPSLEIHLWHCPDPSCSNFHITELNNSYDSPLYTCIDALEEIETDTDMVDFGLIFRDLSKRRDNYHDHLSLEGLHTLLGDCFVNEELLLILKELIVGSKDFRNRLPLHLRKGKPNDIIHGLNSAECLQLILLEKNELVVNTIEELVENEKIIIPYTEIRKPKHHRLHGRHRTFLECNKLGVRTTSKNSALSTVKLKKLITDVHRDSPLKEQLQWKLRSLPVNYSLNQRLEEYLTNELPEDIVNELLLNGPTQLERVFDSFSGHFTEPITKKEETFTTKKILWKTGYNINIYPTLLSNFWSSLTDFRSIASSTQEYNINDQSQIRSSAVNFFVSLEEVLEHTLSFNTWALLSDHYLETKFKYVFEDSRDFMVQTLNDFPLKDDLILKFDASGKNTLFPLLHGFSALLKLCNTTLENKATFKRELNEFPSFYGKDPLNIFPFEHRRLILDLDSTEYLGIKSIYEGIISDFGKGEVLSIRNTLQHKRDSFPSQHEIIRAIEAVKSGISKLENYGLVPDLYLKILSETDRYNRTKVTFENYRNKKITLRLDPQLIGSNLPHLSNPAIFVPNVKLGPTNHPLRFYFGERSEYQSHWRRYPRKKSNTQSV